ncbi:hypothetical protein PPL_11963 [Heterostelium album PN500]|uniref:Aminoglycoside phosphotransferase domain-containing protein n=1 Tax=Heterostelium pallidum (strain ATCC 26659 / Pp 5 / PN500) TaxID=670386 RepID=D3BUZ1_HETP5|nr:hypothetical protein PPL_11963 [Heterostelium album PN500]EFA74929.1 hypothetical protein PPL_11963 [Heterostelium album PN500]|eukprot:XP_020427063.1 hypothetical protein PPL_11963 [Heterostelium album PN500]
MPLFETIAIDLEKLSSTAEKHWGVTVGECIKSSQNHTYIATGKDGEKLILRATPDPQRRRIDSTRLEVKLLDYLADNGLEVCPALKSNITNESLVVMDDPCVIICLYRFAKGEPVVYTEWRWLENKEIVVALGQWFGKLHQLTRRFQVENPDLASTARHWTTLHDSILASYQVDPLDLAVENDSQHFGIIHGDVNPSNYFWQPDVKMVSMFDWDQLQSGYLLYDLSAPIWGVVTLEQHGSTMGAAPENASAKQYTQWLLEGYEPIEGPVDRKRLERMVTIRRELYVRFSKYRHLEFNRYWIVRSIICGSAFIWILALLLGNQFLWYSDGGLFGSNPRYYKYVCSLHLFFTVGSAEPLFFIVFLFILKSKTSPKRSSLYIDDPNYYVVKRSILVTIPVVILHIAILIIAASDVKKPSNQFWNTYDDEANKCFEPFIILTKSSNHQVLISRKFARSLMNKNLLSRIKLSALCFILFLPLELATRILIFFLDIKQTQALYYAFFFVDILVIIIAVSEFVLFPILDSIGFTVSLSSFSIRDYRINSRNYEHIDEKDVISVHTSRPDEILTPKEPKPQITTQQKMALKQKLQQQTNNNNNTSGNNNSNGNDIEMDRLKNKIFNRVKDTEDINNNPSSPFSSPLTSSTSNKSPPPLSLLSGSPTNNNNNNSSNNNNNNNLLHPQQHPIGSVSSTSSTSSSGHERKKSRRFSLAINIKKKTPSPTESPILTPTSVSPTSTTRILQPTPVDDFKSQLMKYSHQNQRF